MADTVISEAPAEQSGAETQARGPLSMEDLAASFVDQVEQDQEATTDEAKAEVTESSEDAEASVEEDVLSQSISEEQEEDTEEEEAEESDEEEETVEEEPPKAVGKLLKQVNKLTARAKSAEETAEALKAEIQNLKTQGTSQGEPAKQPELENIQSFDDLKKLQQEAQAAKKFALQNIGKDYVEVDGKEYSDDDIRNILTQADEYLTEKIPARANYLQQKAQWQQDTAQSFPWLYNTEDDSDYAEASRQLYASIRNQGQYAEVLNNLPNGDFVAGVLVKGIQAIQAEKSAKAKPAKKATKPKAPPPTDGGNVSPPVENATTRKQKQKESIKRKGPLSANDLAAYLSD